MKATPGLIRDSHRLREVSIQSMIEGTAKARLGRALTTRTLPAGEREDYQIGEEVNLFRPARNKDTSGWVGPAVITDTSRFKRGTITVRHLNHIIEVKLGDMRIHLHFTVLERAATDIFLSFENAWSMIRSTIESLPNKLAHVIWSHLEQRQMVTYRRVQDETPCTGCA